LPPIVALFVALFVSLFGTRQPVGSGSATIDLLTLLAQANQFSLSALAVNRAGRLALEQVAALFGVARVCWRHGAAFPAALGTISQPHQERAS
jgi:hypothetical protein